MVEETGRDTIMCGVESAGAVGLVAVNALMFVIFGMIFPIMLTLLFLLVGAAIGYLITLLAR
jgi:hypothetical protein